MAHRRAPKPKRDKPYGIVARKARKSMERRLKNNSITLEHDKSLEVAIERVRRLPHKDLKARQEKYLTEIVRAEGSRQAWINIAAMTPEQFREFIIGKLMHNHSK